MRGLPLRDPASAGPRRRLLQALRLLLTLALCALAWTWLLAHANLGALAMEAERLPAWAWVLAAAGLLAGHAARAVRLQRDWRHAGHVSWWRCLRLVLGHNALVIMLPFRAGEAAYLVAVRRQWGVAWAGAGLALLRWRLQDVAVLLVLAALLLVPGTLPLRLATAAAVVVLLALLVPPAWRWLAARTAAANRPAGQGVWAGLVASIANWGCKVLANGGLLAALAQLPLTQGWRAALGGELAGVQPFQPPAGLGTYEGGIWLAAGAPAGWEARVVAAALAVHAFSLAVALIAAGVTQLAVPAGRLQEEVLQ